MKLFWILFLLGATVGWFLYTYMLILCFVKLFIAFFG